MSGERKKTADKQLKRRLEGVERVSCKEGYIKCRILIENNV